MINPTIEDAERHGRIVLQVTGKTACQLMMEHAQMFGYLKEMARTNEAIAEFIKDFER